MPERVGGIGVLRGGGEFPGMEREMGEVRADVEDRMGLFLRRGAWCRRKGLEGEGGWGKDEGR